MSTTRNLPFVLAVALGIGALAPAVHAQDSARVEKPSADLITRSQIEETKMTTAYDVVQSLRGNWLVERMPVPQMRSSTSPDTSKKTSYDMTTNGAGRSAPGQAGGVQVYLDGTRVGGTDELKNMRAADIASIRHYNGTDAQARFGIGHGSGVVFVTSVAQGARQP